ncbi:MAG: T9SS type A sorting domain-containing protein, partial [Chitinophagales bacterium]|nr:T9SS type A sorting domain-containing protein [Chitinophagales bacterium]
ETNALVSSINEVNSNITQASVYPNPSKEFATIVYDSKLNSETKIQLFDLAGRKYYESSFNSKSGLNAQTISLPSLADGLYHMILSAGNEKLNFKLVVAQ